MTDIGYDGQRTLGALLSYRAAERGDTTFVRCGGQQISYREADERANRAAHALAALGVGAGDTVCILLDNSVEFLDAWFGLAKLGAVEVPINCAYKGWQLRGILAECDAGILVTEERYLPVVLPLLSELPAVRAVVITGGDPADYLDRHPDGHSVPDGVRLLSWPLLVAGQPSTAPEVAIEPHDPVSIMLTSGTTSASKGVLLCHEHEFHVSEVIGGHLGLGGDDVFYNFFPLFHNASQGMITWSVLRFGATMVLTERFSATHFWPDVLSHGCTVFMCMGPMVDFLLAHEERAPRRSAHPLRMGWGIGYGEAQAQRFEERFGVPLVGGYGATEIGMVTLHPLADPRRDTAGIPLPYCEVRIVDEHDRPLPVGEAGEIVVRPLRPYITTLGYHNRPEDTVRFMRNCWLHTGDLGRFDADGYLHFVDRLKDVIRRRGENVSSFEIEAVVSGYPGVVECAAVATPSDQGRHDDEIYVALVVEPGHEIDLVALAEYCADQLAYFAVPRYVEVWDALPRTPTGKVRKTDIRTRGRSERTWDRVAAGIVPARTR